MNGLIIVNKDKDMTSRDVINKLEHIFSFKKIGHTGTLDPIATGVLVCVFGKYTKLVDTITSMDKEYIAEVKLGIKTDTSDITGNVIKTSDVNITKEEVDNVLKNFPKSYEQTVPKYSAVKIDGKKLYEYARKNEDVKLPSRLVNIYNLELLEFNSDSFKFKAHVSKGTYIRSLIEDICKNLNTLGTMSNLIRTKQGKFLIENSYSLEDIENNNYKLLNIHEFLDYPSIDIPQEYLKTIKNGGKIDNVFDINDKVIFTYNNEDVAIYEANEKTLKPFVMF